jgi:hypothetical protein
LKWKLFKRKSLQQHFNKNAEHYLQTWVSYHEEILDFIRDTPSSKVLTVHYEDLVEYDYSYFIYLTEVWKLDMEFAPFKTIFKPAMLSKVHNISLYVKNKALLEKAFALDRWFSILKEDSLATVTSCEAS